MVLSYKDCIKIALKHENEVLTASQVLELFEYSPNTNVTDTKIYRDEIVRRVDRTFNKYRVLVPRYLIPKRRLYNNIF